MAKFCIILNQKFQNFVNNLAIKFNAKLVFNLFKIKNCFSYEDFIPNNLKSFFVYKVTYTVCSSRDIGKIC